MENKIAFPQLVAMLALATGKQKETCENFLKEFFRSISEDLGRGESIRIKGFGTFKLVDVEARRSVNVATGESHEIPGHSKISFIPSKEMASLVNKAFEAFEAVEVSDDVSMDELMEPEEVLDEQVQEPVEIMEEPVKEPVEIEEKPVKEPVEIEEKPAQEPAEIVTGIYTDVPAEDVPAEDVPDENEPDEHEPRQEVIVTECAMKSHKFGWGFFAGFMTALVTAAVGLLIWITVYFNSHDSEGDDFDVEVVAVSSVPEAEEQDSAKSDTAIMSEGDTTETGIVNSGVLDSDVPTKPSDEKVYDTISTTRFLTTMAKEHYGNFNLWPIIYEENQAILGHPDRIKPGTQVVVPPLSKYGIDPKNTEDVKRIKAKGVAIYAKYK